MGTTGERRSRLGGPVRSIRAARAGILKPLRVSLPEAIDKPSLLERYRLDERSRWSRFISKAFLVAVVVSAVVDLVGLPRGTENARVLLLTRAASVVLAVVVYLSIRLSPPRTVDEGDGRVRGALWVHALLLGVAVGAAGEVSCSVACLCALTGFFPTGMRRLHPLRWVLGGSLWILVTTIAAVAFHGAQAFTLARLSATATGLVLIGGLYTLGKIFMGRAQRSHAVSLELRSLGHYELVRRIGVGGMGEVWEAHHPALKVEVAVKVLRLDSQRSVARFETEARTMASLVHPNTVRIFDYGIVGDSLFYYAMDRVHGKNLGALVAGEGPLRAERALRLVRQIASALHAAHKRGLVHRDIKPENVLVCSEAGESDVVKVIDFGLVFHAVERGEDGERMTLPGRVLGTPVYLSPETAVGDEPTSASDVYALGCVLYFLLTGRPPFVGDSPREIIAAHVRDAPEPPGPLAPWALSPEVEALVLRCLSKDPKKRPRSGRPLIDAIDAALRPLRPAASESVALGSLPALVDDFDSGESSVQLYPD